MSLPRMAGAICGALVVLLGAVVLVGSVVAPNLPPMPRDTAVSFALSGAALLGIVMSRPRLTFIGSAITSSLALVSLQVRMSPVPALCFILLATGFALAQADWLTNKSPLLGVTGFLVAAVGATCCISVLSGASDSFAWGNVAFHTSVGLLMLGIGAAAVAFDMTQP